MLMTEQAVKEEVLELLERLYRKMCDDVKLSKTSLVEIEYTDDDDNSLVGISVRPLEETSYARQRNLFRLERSQGRRLGCIFATLRASYIDASGTNGTCCCGERKPEKQHIFRLSCSRPNRCP